MGLSKVWLISLIIIRYKIMKVSVCMCYKHWKKPFASCGSERSFVGTRDKIFIAYIGKHGTSRMKAWTNLMDMLMLHIEKKCVVFGVGQRLFLWSPRGENVKTCWNRFCMYRFNLPKIVANHQLQLWYKKVHENRIMGVKGQMKLFWTKRRRRMIKTCNSCRDLLPLNGHLISVKQRTTCGCLWRFRREHEGIWFLKLQLIAFENH